MHEAWYDAAMTMEQKPATGEDGRGRKWQQELAAGVRLAAAAVAEAAAMTNVLATEMDELDTQQWQRLKLAAETVTQLAAAAEAVQRVADWERKP
jgi:hypothetical protein